MMICNDLHKIIFDFMTFYDKIEYSKINKSNNKRLYIAKLDDTEIKSSICQLAINNNPNLTSIKLHNFYHYDSILNLDNLKFLKEIDSKCRNLIFDKCTNLKKLKFPTSYRQFIASPFVNLIEFSHTGDIFNLKSCINLESLNVTGTKSHMNDIYFLTNLTKLILDNPADVYCLNILTKLSTLHISNFYSVKTHDINKLTNLTELQINNCGKINFKLCTNINFLKCYWFDVDNLNHMTNLTTLDIENCNKVDDYSVIDLTKLETLILKNSRITDINQMTMLTELHANSRSSIKETGFIDCTNINFLNIPSSTTIKNINHLTNLTFLNIDDFYNICDTGFINCTNIRNLRCKDNKNVTNINHLINLTELNISGQCNVNDHGISKCTNLKSLCINGNKNITNISHLTNLTYLDDRNYIVSNFTINPSIRQLTSIVKKRNGRWKGNDGRFYKIIPENDN